LPLNLSAGAVAHQSIRYKTSTSADAPGCVQAGWMDAITTADMGSAALLVSKSLLKPICSVVDVGGYRPGPGDVTPLDTVPPAGERQLMLRTDRATYYEDEWFAVQTDPRSNAKGAQPILLLAQRSPTGETRLDEVQPDVLPLGYSYRQEGRPNLGFAEIDSGARSRWSGLGEHSFQLFQVDGTTSNGELHFLRSKPLAVVIADAATIARKWGVAQQGVRVDLTLDKTQFCLGEDIAAHIAAQIVEAKEPVVGALVHNFHLNIGDEDGPLENSEPWANLQGLIVESFGPILDCSATPDVGKAIPLNRPAGLELGKVIPLNRSLRALGLLPTRPGKYQLSVAWRAYHAPSRLCPPEPEQPLVTVTSNAVTITVVGEPRPTQLPQFPEYTAWKSRFRLIDTALGREPPYWTSQQDWSGFGPLLPRAL
jgi:hypothetical protein